MSATQKAGFGLTSTLGRAKVVIGIAMAALLAGAVAASMVSPGGGDGATGDAEVLSQPVPVPGIPSSDTPRPDRVSQFEESEGIKFPRSDGHDPDRVSRFEESERIRWPSSDGYGVDRARQFEESERIKFPHEGRAHSPLFRV